MALVYAYLRYSVPVSGDSETAGFAPHIPSFQILSPLSEERGFGLSRPIPLVLGLS
jgi:hypothetical protein